MQKMQTLTNSARFSEDWNFPLQGFFFDQPDMPPHRQEFTEVVFILHGRSAHFTAPGGWGEIRRGDVWFIPANGIHGYRDSRNLKIFNLLFIADRLPVPLLDLYAHPGYRKLFAHDCGFWKSAGTYPRLTLKPKQIPEFESLLQHFVRFQQMSSTVRNCGKYGIFMALISKLCDLALPEKFAPVPPNPLSVTKITRFLNENYAAEIGIPELMKMTAMSESTLRRHFQKAFGTTPIAYLQNFRLEVAARLLLNTTLSVKEITRLSGFNTLSYFSEIFRRTYQKSPSQYRQKQ